MLAEALASLNKYSLVNLTQENVSIHRLVQAVLRQQQLSNFSTSNKQPLSLMQSKFEKLFESLDEIFWNISQEEHHERMQQKLFPHYLSLIEHYKKTESTQNTAFLARALGNVGWIFQYYFHDFPTAKSYFEQSLSIFQKNNTERESCQ